MDSLIVAGSPRLLGENADHVAALADLSAELPPILVHKDTGRVIDGAHRVRAAVLRGDTMIRARYFEGSAREAFVLAVRMNNSHGLPLSLADRKAAGGRLLESFPEWSDRAIAEVAGVSHHTIGRIRRCSGGEAAQTNTRLGRDGRTHTLAAEDGRRRVGEFIARHPEASIRRIATATGVSVGTVHDVRRRLDRGEDPVPSRTKPVPGTAVPCGPGRTDTSGLRRDLGTVIEVLRSDPSLRFSDSGRSLLRRLAAQPSDENEWAVLAQGVPEHCTSMIAELADTIARDWLNFARRLNES
ncbi:ParB/RepB/Spo0J family partition protein [Nocardia fluminea]|uniref:ParB/RepB/Spo0J family partition protein n=1 Tax=Nocardia fluminea TaxID=134984 RepID=UPI0034167F3F